MTDENYCKECHCWLLSHELKQTGYCCNCNTIRTHAKQEVLDDIEDALDRHKQVFLTQSFEQIKEKHLSPINDNSTKKPEEKGEGIGALFG